MSQGQTVKQKGRVTTDTGAVSIYSRLPLTKTIVRSLRAVFNARWVRRGMDLLVLTSGFANTWGHVSCIILGLFFSL